MFVIAFPHNFICGGLGDRLVGLVSVLTLSQLVHKPFYIIWDKENITPYFNYEKYNYRLCELKVDRKQCKIFNSIDKQTKYKDDLMTKDLKHYFSSQMNLFVINQEISQYAYCNPLYQNQKTEYYKTILRNYNRLFKEILIPTQFITNKIDTICGPHKNIIGIQFRCGDAFMQTNRGERHTTNISNTMLDKVKSIKYLLSELKDYKVFITSDHPKAHAICCGVFGKDSVLYNHDMIQHLDRRNIQRDFSKTFVDCLILSQKTTHLFITECSNFGRIAALTCNHNVIFNENGKKLDKIDLLSKHEKFSNL